MAVESAWYTVYAQIQQNHRDGMYLGRNVRHDSRNRSYPWQRKVRTLTSQLWPRQIPILDQLKLGSCTGNTAVGALGTVPMFAALPPGMPPLNEDLAVSVYSDAEKLDGGVGLPAEDNGSTGPSVGQVLKNRGWSPGYLHCFGLGDLLDALEEHPAGIGANWYESMFSPDSSGLVAVSAGSTVAGGHEFLCRGKDVDAQMLFFDNSWGTAWGKNGSFSMSYATMERLLGEQGDATIFLPLSAPAPTPTPTPDPVPVTPAPTPADVRLHNQTLAWTQIRHSHANETVARDLRAWYNSKGF